jgi:toxin FitB
MNVVDSSAWLEYFADGPHATAFAAAIGRPRDLVVPTLTLYEVFKGVCQQRGERDALLTVAQMHQGLVVDLTAELAVSAARLAIGIGLPMADSIMLATSRAYGATLWTQDAHFEGLAGVRFIPPPTLPR